MDTQDFLTDQAIDPDGSVHNRRRKTWYDLVVASGSIAGAAVAITVFFSVVFDKLPFAKASDLATVVRRVDLLDGSIASLQVNQLESLELQLTDRVQKLGDQMAKLPVGSAVLIDLRHEQNEAQQRLTSIHNQLLILQRQPAVAAAQ